LAGQLRVREDMIMATIRHIDDTQDLVAKYCWRATMAHDSSYGEFAIEDFQTFRERVTVMRIDYQQLLMDRDYLLEVGEMYHGALKENETKVDQLTHELVSTQGFLKGTHTTLKESEPKLEELLEEASQGSTASISTESQIYTSTTSLEDVGGLIEEQQLMDEREGYPKSLKIMERCDPKKLEDVHVSQGSPFMGSSETVGQIHTHGDSRAKGSYEDIHVEVDPTLHPSYMMMQELAWVYRGIQ
jgi:hypothetical protein